MGGKIVTGENVDSPRTSVNPKRYVWIFMGYYLFATLMKANALPYGRADKRSDFAGGLTTPEVSTESTTAAPEHHSGIQIFKFDFDHVESVMLVTLWIFCAGLAKIAFHVTPKLGRIIPESCILILMGVLIGFLFTTTNFVSDTELNTNTFFFFMLPPIILDAGYFMPSRLFFGNLGTILLFAVIGTIYNAFAIGLSLYGLALTDLFGVEISLLELLLFSTLISAVDPVAVLAVFEEIHVNDILYIVVFGESLLNDAVTVVLYHMFEEYAVMGEENVTPTEILKGCASFPVVALGGTLIGIIWGLLSGFMTRFTHNALVIEPVFVFVMAYLSYLNAEMFHMSGVLAITFCGIIMKKYVEANIAPNSNITVKYAMRMLSSSSETIIFMYLGVSTVNDNHVWNWWFVIATIVFCTVYRFVGVLWMTALANRFRLNKINMVDQFVMSYGGLRGAVSFALVLLINDKAVKDPHIQRMFVTTTIAMVFFTVFVQGITIKPFVEWLKVEKSKERELTMNERLHERMMDHTLSALEIILGTTGQNIVRDKVKHWDETFIRPYLIRDYQGTAQAKILETYSKLEMQDVLNAKDALKKQRQTPTIVHQPSEDSVFSDEPTAIPLQKKVSIDEPPTKKVSTIEPPRTKKLSTAEAPQRKKSSKGTDGPIDIMTDDIFKPAVKKQRKISYSRQMIDPGDLEGETIAIAMSVPGAQGRPRRKFGVPNLGSGESVEEGYSNPGFSFDDERSRDFTREPYRRVSTQESPISSVPPSPKYINPASGPNLVTPSGKQRRYSSATVQRPPTAADLEGTPSPREGMSMSVPSSPSQRRVSPSTSFEYPPVRSPPAFATTIPEESSD